VEDGLVERVGLVFLVGPLCRVLCREPHGALSTI
jgi:hypothetical protein